MRVCKIGSNTRLPDAFDGPCFDPRFRTWIEQWSMHGPFVDPRLRNWIEKWTGHCFGATNMNKRISRGSFIPRPGLLLSIVSVAIVLHVKWSGFGIWFWCASDNNGVRNTQGAQIPVAPPPAARSFGPVILAHFCFERSRTLVQKWFPPR